MFGPPDDSYTPQWTFVIQERASQYIVIPSCDGFPRGYITLTSEADKKWWEQRIKEWA